MVRATFRELHDDVLYHRGDDLRAEVLVPWRARAGKAIQWLADFARRDGDPWPAATRDERRTAGGVVVGAARVTRARQTVRIRW